MKPDSFFEEYAENGYNTYGVVTGNNSYDGKPLPEWKDLKPYQHKAYVALVKSVFQKLAVRDERGRFYVEKDWKPEPDVEAIANLTNPDLVGETLDDLKLKYTGVLEAVHYKMSNTYDFTWNGGNDYVIVYNTFLEDVSEEYGKFYRNGELLTLTGTNHEIELELFKEYPELEVKVFKKIGSKTKVV